MRTRKLFENLFDESTPDVQTRRGRSEKLIALRNDALTDRYYYYGKFTDKRYEVILDLLSNEFFISGVTISEVMGDNSNKLSELKAQAPTKEHFKKKWPHFVW